MESKLKHLEMIQGVINRMAGNSFSLKGWGVSLVAGIFALASKDADKSYFLVAYIPIIAFWGLDSYYLLQERLYCALYDKIRLLPENQIDLSLRATVEEFGDDKNNYLCCLISKTEICFYFPLAIASTGIIIITHL